MNKKNVFIASLALAVVLSVGNFGVIRSAIAQEVGDGAEAAEVQPADLNQEVDRLDSPTTDEAKVKAAAEKYAELVSAQSQVACESMKAPDADGAAIVGAMFAAMRPEIPVAELSDQELGVLVFSIAANAKDLCVQ